MPQKAFFAALAAMLAAAFPANAAPLGLSGAEAVAASRKIQCSTKDLRPVVFHWEGKAFSRAPGEPDRVLFGLQGMNIRQCVSVQDPKRGQGFRLVSRELMLYLAPGTDQVLQTWRNPWTGKDVEVFHVANDPVNSREPTFERDQAGAPFTLDARVDAGRVFMPIEVPLFYRNPLGGEYQDNVGGHYHAMEIFDFILDEKTLRDRRVSEAKPAIAWVRIAPWLPWMAMGSRPGGMVFNATGQAVAGVEALPPVLRQEIAQRYPAYASPPPGDDARPNETSWTVFKKAMDKRKAEAGSR